VHYSIRKGLHPQTTAHRSRILQYVASILAGKGVSGALGRAYSGGKVARGGCSLAWNYSVTRSTVFTEAERIH